MKTTIKIFLASSDELSEERTAVELFFGRENKKLAEKNIFIDLVIWEELLHSFGGERTQDYFNEEMLKCDVVLTLFFKKVGQFTKEEFELAHKNLKEKNKPQFLYVYFKNSDIPSNEITKDYMKIIELKEDIEKHEQYYCTYDSIDNLKNQLKKQIDQIIDISQRGEVSEPKHDDTQNIPETTPVISETYLNWLSDHCAYMDVDRLRERGKAIQIGLPEIYIPLYTNEPGQQSGDKHHIEEKERKIDIEDLIGKNESLLIEGHPGSGKTTLFKHLTYSLTKSISVKGLDGYIPILIFLKDTKHFLEKNRNIKPSATTAQKILSSYFKVEEKGINLETIEAFCCAKKAIFLLDGLDEVKSEYRDVIVNSFADYRIQHNGVKVVFSGRPHGIEGSAIDRFGKNHVKILSLNMDQVEEFIKKWFYHIYSKSSSLGGKTAEVMISEIKTHPAIERLIDNPLMLTAICILYHDGKELPGQRAELYKKFVDNLIYKRFKEVEQVSEFLMTLAFEMHIRRVKGVDRKFASNILEKVCSRHDKETDTSYQKRMDSLFENIEPNCGLLKREDGQYLFWHLTFQEYLTARYIMNTSIDYAKDISEYWGNDWYNEVINLYIGSLSIENKNMANQIIKNIITNDDINPYKKWLLASQSLIDIHNKKRNEDVLSKVKERLLEAMDDGVVPETRVRAGEILGWLGDTRNLKEFVKILGGKHELEIGLIDIKPFEISKYPVTNSWFEEFIHADGYKNEDYWSKEGLRWLAHTKAEHPEFWNERKWKCPNSPVVGVSWYEADAFTKWLSAVDSGNYEYRLLEENEWEAVAAGLEGREYPWSNEWDKNKCNNGEIELGKTSPVGIFKEGNTPDNISDLSGNVWEWTTSDYHSKNTLIDFTFDDDMQKLLDEKKFDDYVKKLNEKNRKSPVLRGGSWRDDGDGCRCAYRRNDAPVIRGDGIGFRCARTLTL